MFLEVLFFLALGIAIGVIFGLLPGVHPNMIILFMPLFASFSLEAPVLIAFVTAVAVANSITSFVPSILLGVPDAGNEMSILPGHRLFMQGRGYQAIKLTVVGGIGAILFCAAAFPLLVMTIPLLFGALSGGVHVLLVSIAAVMVLTEKKKISALALFAASGAIGVLSSRLPIDSTLVLFPIFSGFFGTGMVLQARNKTKIPCQGWKEAYVSRRTLTRSALSGSAGGILSGLLPGVGASEVAALASSGKDEHAFLVRMGAINAANIILSILGLWLINKSRSGLAVVIEQLADVGFSETALALFAAMAAGGMASALAITAARKSLSLVENLGQGAMSAGVVIFIIALTFVFTGWMGLLLFLVCSAIGIITNMCGIKRGMLMGVLMVPTIIFYLQTA